MSRDVSKGPASCALRSGVRGFDVRVIAKEEHSGSRMRGRMKRKRNPKMSAPEGGQLTWHNGPRQALFVSGPPFRPSNDVRLFEGSTSFYTLPRDAFLCTRLNSQSMQFLDEIRGV